MIKIQSVVLDDVDAVRLAIEKQEVSTTVPGHIPLPLEMCLCVCVCFSPLSLQKVLRELKMKKPQLNELVHTAEVLKGDIKRQQLQEKGRIC